MSIETWFSLGAIILSGFAAITAWRKGKSETSNLDSQTMTNYLKLAKDAADQVAEAQKKLDLMELQIAKLEEDLRISREEKAKYENYSAMLRNQIIQQFNGIPVDLKFAESKRAK